MNNATIYRPASRTHPGRELLRLLIRRPATWAVLLILLGFGLRVWALERVPPGWRDDELIETLVISQHILDGNLAFYYPDASGHEALYHALNAVFLALFGPTGPGIRLLSAFLGTLAVPLTYVVGFIGYVLVTFVVNERTVAHPLLDVSLLRDRRFSVPRGTVAVTRVP